MMHSMAHWWVLIRSASPNICFLLRIKKKYLPTTPFYLELWKGKDMSYLNNITKTCLYNFDPLKPHFYIAKLEFTRVYIIFLISAQKHRLWVSIRTALCFEQKYEEYQIILFENFHFLVVKFSRQRPACEMVQSHHGLLSDYRINIFCRIYQRTQILFVRVLV